MGGSSDNTQVALSQSEASFYNELTTLFSQQYATQQKQLNFLNSQMQPVVQEGGFGFSPEALASLRTGATDTIATEYQNAQQALNERVQQASGGSKLTGVSGAVSEETAALLNAQAQTQAGAQETISTQNEQLRQQNYWNAINALNGIAATENPLGYASAATGAGQSSSAASEANTAHIQATNSFGSVLGALGGAASGFLSGPAFGAGGLFGV